MKVKGHCCERESCEGFRVLEIGGDYILFFFFTSAISEFHL